MLMEREFMSLKTKLLLIITNNMCLLDSVYISGLTFV